MVQKMWPFATSVAETDDVLAPTALPHENPLHSTAVKMEPRRGAPAELWKVARRLLLGQPERLKIPEHIPEATNTRAHPAPFKRRTQ